ncbi:MAG: glycosyltransferase family 4 protein [Egibacteraceae bacterium]
MRVGLVIYGSLETLTGGYLYDRKLAEHLSAHGDDVEVISLPWRNYVRHLCDNVSSSLAGRLEGTPFDVLVQDELNHPSLVLMNRRLKSRSQYPIVAVVHVLRVNEHGESPLRPLYAVAEQRYLASVDAAVFCCEATRAAAEGLVGHSMPGVVVHPACDHLAPRAPEGETVMRARQTGPPAGAGDPGLDAVDASGPIRVVSVANVVPRKGLHVLIESLARLPIERWRLTVVGSLTMDPVYVRRVRHLIGHAGVGSCVELVGAVANSEIPAYLAQSHVLVVPSSYEGLAIAYLEAMRFGLPVIATTAGGANEVVEHGREGFLVAPGDVESLTRHLGLLLRDRDLLLRMGLAARRRVERHPTWEQSLGRARAFLCSTVDSHRRMQGQEAS